METDATVRDLKEDPDPDRRVRFNDLLGGASRASEAVVNMDELLAIAKEESGQRVLLFKSGARLAVTEQVAKSLQATVRAAI